MFDCKSNFNSPDTKTSRTITEPQRESYHCETKQQKFVLANNSANRQNLSQTRYWTIPTILTNMYIYFNYIFWILLWHNIMNVDRFPIFILLARSIFSETIVRFVSTFGSRI